MNRYIVVDAYGRAWPSLGAPMSCRDARERLAAFEAARSRGEQIDASGAGHMLDVPTGLTMREVGCGHSGSVA